MLQNPYAHLDGEGRYDAVVPGTSPSVIIPPNDLLNGRKKGKKFSKRTSRKSHGRCRSRYGAIDETSGLVEEKLNLWMS